MDLLHTLAQSTTDIMASPKLYNFWVFLSFFYGALFGSFLNVCILRLPLGMSVFEPKRSFCFRCGTQIAWYDNIPILSYVILGGRDRACGAPYSPRYALIELMTGVIFVVIFYMWNEPGNFSFMTLWYFVFACLLIIGTFTDLDHWISLEKLTTGGTIAAVLFALLAGFFDKDSMIALSGPFPYVRLGAEDWIERVMNVIIGRGYQWQPVEIMWWEPVANSLIGMVFAPCLIVGVSKAWEIVKGQEGMGFGDAEIFALIGATFGAQHSLLAFVFASFIGAFLGLSLIAYQTLTSKGKDWEKSPLRLGRWKDDGSEKAVQANPSIPGTEEEPDEYAETTPEEIEQTKALAESLDEKFINLDETEFDPELIDQFPAALAMDHLVMPLERKGQKKSGEGGKWIIAVQNPLSTSLINAIQKSLATEVQFHIAPESQLLKYTDEYFNDRYEETTESEKQRNELKELNRKAWQNFSKVARSIPPEKTLGSMPFIPAIAGGSFIILLAYPWVLSVLRSLFVVEIQ